MKLKQMMAGLCALMAVGAGMTTAVAAPQNQNRPLLLVVPYPPGGSTDILARIMQPQLSKELGGRPVVVENRPGAASQIATNHVARAEPDGNTLLVSFDNHAINPAVRSTLPYDTFKDLVGVAHTVRFPLVIGANPKVPGDNLAQFIEAARKQPADTYNYASTGVGSLNHLAPEEFKQRSGVSLLHVPYGGAGPAVQAVVGGQADMTWLSFAALRGQIQAGKIKPLAVAGEQRLPELPDVPTLAESGLPGMVAYSWSGIFAPAGTPKPVIGELERAFMAVLKNEDVKRKLNDAGFEVVGSDGASADAYTKDEFKRWDSFIKANQINLDN
ncbi:tripartite tricarboxylate transporter substrate binding protein [Bordetella trematum]|uniref:tripartite tricarboxylate transporter substrate binding protein n=1 Tax=Bordetella trematum TaxID=123899 RepID=UPI000D939155|nr:tripartite tricarboxylate transporter substrate binding protein [Bordetella trematum]SPU49394.1 lipoprotein [Bordetella trematum]VDH08782.1 Argininosuccinate lyase [Bordetella trematum]